MIEMDYDKNHMTPTQFYASNTPVVNIPFNPELQNLRRSTRGRQSLNFAVTKTEPRKRTLSTSALVNSMSTNPTKKIRLDDKKAQTNAMNLKKEARDKARKKWLYCHRALILTLLPSDSSFFEKLEKDIGMWGENESVSFVPLHELDEQPKLVKGGRMKDYQLQGLSFLVSMYKNGMNCILGDEMGLGKTLQTLSLFAYIKENVPGPHDPHLVICPLSVLSSWESEAARWLPSMRVIRFHGSRTERDRIKESARGDRAFDIMLTTYDVYVSEEQWFKSHRWMYCVLDEGHKIKHYDTNIAHKVQNLGCLFRLILTGTPVQNNLLELWGLLHWLYPSVFTDASERLFRNSFDLSRGSYSIPFLNASTDFLSTVMLRRTKAVVMGEEIPPREELTVFIPLTDTQRFWTYRLLTKMDTPNLLNIFSDRPGIKLEDDENASQGRGEDVSSSEIVAAVDGIVERNQWKKLMNLLLQLRRICDHPYLLPNAEPEPYDIAEHIVTASSKLIAIDKILADILPKGERALIFSQWTGMLDILEDFLVLRGISFARLDGSMPRPRRSLDIKLFQQEVSPFQVYLISTKAGGLGINLTKATTVIMCDSDWNPQNDLQAIARAHRIGQTKTVKVYRLICQGSVEDQMLDRIRRKLFLSMKIMGSSDGSSSSEAMNLGLTALMNILRKGSSALAASGIGMSLARFLDADISDILEDSRSLEKSREAKIKQELRVEEVDGGNEKLLLDAEEEERRLLSGVAQVQSRLFEGKMVQHQQSNSEIANEWRDLSKRARVDRTVVVDGMTFIMTPPAPTTVLSPPKVVTKQRKKFGSEDWCIHCRDGGQLILCTRCPRVFHAKCRGLTQAESRKSTVLCSQHSCASCYRNTTESGGMLFRCRTCPQAFCEDCLPPGEINPIGDALPEFELLDYGQSSNAYYIKCHDCREDFARLPDSLFWVEWEAGIREAEQKLKEKYADLV